MRTTLDIPRPLLDEVKRILGVKSDSAAVVFSLTELVRFKRIEHLKELMAHVHLDLDVEDRSFRGRRK